MSANFSKKKIGCKITDIKPDPLHKERMIIAVEFDDGDAAGPWHQAFSVIPEKVITIEDFLNQLYTQKIERPVDPYQNIKRVMQSGEKFVLDLTAQIETKTEN
jgi:hypothetical protein